jgi:hypothetical protein
MPEIKTKNAAQIFNTIASDPSASKRRSTSGHAWFLDHAQKQMSNCSTSSVQYRTSLA